MRALLKALLWLVALGAFIAVALTVAAVVLYRRHANRRQLEALRWQEWQRAQVYGLAYVDPAGRCGWCGGEHGNVHPAVFHAQSVAVRVQDIAA